MRYLIPILCIFLLSCSLKYETSMCRHRSIECALVYGEKVGNENVGIAIGPSKSTVWHGQAYILSPLRWIVNTGNACEIGDQEDFSPQIWMTTGEFMKMQFGWVK